MVDVTAPNAAPAPNITFAMPDLKKAPVRTKSKKSSWTKRILTFPLIIFKNPKYLMMAIAIGVVAVFVLVATTYVVFANSLATPEAIINRKNVGLIFYDRDGQEFYHTGEARDTTLIPFEEIPQTVKDATVAIEDKDFYNHGGFSVSSIGRAVLTNIQIGDATAMGGSTITQQLVKNALLTQKKSYIRKLQEVVLAIEIDRRYSKDQILQLYLTSTFYGSNSYGVKEAAETYFNKDLSKLTLAEAAVIAGLPQAPSAYSPLDGDPELTKQRQRQVLNNMSKYGYVTQAQAEAALAATLSYHQGGGSLLTDAPHFVEYVTQMLAKKYGEEEMTRSGFKIYTTLDSSLQNKAQDVVAKRIAGLTKTGANNGAVVAMNPQNGEILAMVGSADYSNDEIQGKFNFATGPQQPGSATKPFMYMRAFEEGVATPATILEDKETNYGGYTPKNADGRFRGSVTVRTALANSLNIPAVTLLQDVGARDFVATLKEFGADSLNNDAATQCGLSVVLGCAEVSLLDLSHAYASLADEGVYHDVMPYTKIVDKNGKQIYPQKSFLFNDNDNGEKRVIDAAYTYMISDILNDNNARSMVFGANSSLKLSRKAAVKTGTTDENRDAWTFGYTPDLLVGVWVGNTFNTPMTIAGATAAAPIWKEIMESQLRGTPEKWYTQPSNVTKLWVCRGTENIADQQAENTFQELFARQHMPSGNCAVATPTPTPTPELTPTPTPTPSSTPTALPTITPLPSISPTPKPSVFPTIGGGPVGVDDNP